MADIREIKLPENAKHGVPGKQVDLDKAALELGVDKVMLTKAARPQFLEWVRKQP